MVSHPQCRKEPSRSEINAKHPEKAEPMRARADERKFSCWDGTSPMRVVWSRQYQTGGRGDNPRRYPDTSIRGGLPMNQIQASGGVGDERPCLNARTQQSSSPLVDSSVPAMLSLYSQQKRTTGCRCQRNTRTGRRRVSPPTDRRTTLHPHQPPNTCQLGDQAP